MENDQILQVFPETVGEYIDTYMLPDLANGKNNSTQVTDEIINLAEGRLEKAKEDEWFYHDGLYDMELIDSYFVLPQHKDLIVRYVQCVFDSWNQSIEVEE